MTPRQSSALTLIDSGLTYTQAARAMGVSKGTIAGLVHRSRHPKDRKPRSTPKSAYWDESRLTQKWADRPRP